MFVYGSETQWPVCACCWVNSPALLNFCCLPGLAGLVNPGKQPKASLAPLPCCWSEPFLKRHRKPCTIKRQGSSTPAKVLDAVLSHQGLPHKADLITRVMAALVLPAPAAYRTHLRRLAALAGGVKGAGEVAARAAALLVRLLFDFVFAVGYAWL